MNSNRLKLLYGLVAVLVLIIAVLSFLIWKGSSRTVMPRQLAGLNLVKLTEGEEAKAAINQLHGTSIKIKDGYIAMYQGTSGRAMLWVSISKSEEEARQLLDLMTEKIRDGTEFFKNLKSFTAGKFRIYSVEGGGQTHFYYGISNKTIWLAADPPIAEQALDEVLVKIR